MDEKGGQDFRHHKCILMCLLAEVSSKARVWSFLLFLWLCWRTKRGLSLRVCHSKETKLEQSYKRLLYEKVGLRKIQEEEGFKIVKEA